MGHYNYICENDSLALIDMAGESCYRPPAGAAGPHHEAVAPLSTQHASNTRHVLHRITEEN